MYSCCRIRTRTVRGVTICTSRRSRCSKLRRCGRDVRNGSAVETDCRVSMVPGENGRKPTVYDVEMRLVRGKTMKKKNEKKKNEKRNKTEFECTVGRNDVNNDFLFFFVF